MRMPFWKMHGAANDFILVDDRQGTFPARDGEWLAKIMARRTGVGSEGVLLIQSSDRADFRMQFFNPDGREADMCGNGARCIARLAHDLGVAPATMTFETRAGPVRAEVRGPQVLLHLMDPKDWRLNRTLQLGGQTVAYHFVNSGVPHAVVVEENVEAVNVQELGSGIRRHEDFAPAGTNANFVQVTGPQSLRVRTYERGVEAETLACGTGMIACAVIAGRLALVKAPVRVVPASGDELQVDFTLREGGAEQVTLLGPAEYVFRGELEYPQ